MPQWGEGNGTPHQYSCLENPMDGGAWWAAVHGVTKNQAWLSDFPFTFHLHALEKEMATHSSVLAWRIPGTGEPGGLPSMGSHRVRHDWSDLAVAAAVCLRAVALHRRQASFMVLHGRQHATPVCFALVDAEFGSTGGCQLSALRSWAPRCVVFRSPVQRRLYELTSMDGSHLDPLLLWWSRNGDSLSDSVMPAP